MGDQVGVSQGGFGVGRCFSSCISPCPCYAMSPKKFPRGQIHSQSLISLFLRSFAVGLLGEGRQLLGQPHPCGKKFPMGLGQEACLHHFHAQASPRKGLSKIKQGRSCLQCDSSAHYEPNRHKLLLGSHFSLERQFLPAASCPPPSPHTHIFQLCIADFNLELYVGQRLHLCHGWSRWEMDSHGSRVCSSICPVPDGDRLFPLSPIPSECAFVCPTQVCLPYTNSWLSG